MESRRCYLILSNVFKVFLFCSKGQMNAHIILQIIKISSKMKTLPHSLILAYSSADLLMNGFGQIFKGRKRALELMVIARRHWLSKACYNLSHSIWGLGDANITYQRCHKEGYIGYCFG